TSMPAPAGAADAGSATGASTPAGATGEGGSGRLSPPPLRARLNLRELSPTRMTIVGAVVVGALLAAWAQWQPQRSVNSSRQALALLARDPRGAADAAHAAVSQDPLSAQALFTLSAVQRATGHPLLARATLQRAVRLQPSNPQTWLTLGEYDLAGDPAAAVNELAAAIYLNPESVAAEAIASGNPEAIAIQNDYVQALRAASAQAAAAAAARTRAQRPAKERRAHAPRSRTGRQKRERTADASSTRRTPGGPPAACTSTCSNPKSPNSR